MDRLSPQTQSAAVSRLSRGLFSPEQKVKTVGYLLFARDKSRFPGKWQLTRTVKVVYGKGLVPRYMLAR